MTFRLVVVPLRALDSHPFFPSHVASGRCVLSAAAAGAPAGVVSAFAEPSGCPPPPPRAPELSPVRLLSSRQASCLSCLFSLGNRVGSLTGRHSERGLRGTRGDCPPPRQPLQPRLAPHPTATAHGLTAGEGRMVVRCRNRHRGERKCCPQPLKTHAPCAPRTRLPLSQGAPGRSTWAQRQLYSPPRVRLPGVPGIQMNVPAINHNALPPNITPSSSPGTRSTSTLYDCWQSNNSPFSRPTNGTITCTLPLWAPSWPRTSKSKKPPLVRDGPPKWPRRRVGVLHPNSRGHAKASDNFARRADVLSLSSSAARTMAPPGPGPSRTRRSAPLPVLCVLGLKL